MANRVAFSVLLTVIVLLSAPSHALALECVEVGQFKHCTPV